MIDTPLVSVGLPVYNGERFLRGCLDSLLAQTHANYEIIISDNASTDTTPCIIESYAARDERIRVVRAKRNLGSHWNHNHVRELARGEYFRWAGADDLIAPRFLEACVTALQETPTAVLAFPLSIVIDESDAPIARTQNRLPLDSPNPVVRFRSLLRSLDATQNAFYGLLRRRYIDCARPLGPFIANDRCLLTELALMGPFVQVEEFLMYRRKHRENTTRNVGQEQRLLTPTDARSFRAREWTVLRKNLAAAARARVNAGTKLGLLRAMSTWVVNERGEFLGECRELASQTVRRMRGRRWSQRTLGDESDVIPSIHV
jgi:glycosyltransferase involved in cell wall biosynthesis